MRFAFSTAPQLCTWDQVLPIWKLADEIDLYESGWTFDHFYTIFSDSTGPCMEAWVTTTALATATKRLRVGVLVTGNVYRHPAVLANMAASLDHVSNGRLDFGFGAGWIVDRFGPRRLMMAGILMAGGALVGLGSISAAWAFYFFYFFNALGYVCGGPLPNQVLLSRWFTAARGKAMGIAYLGIGVGGTLSTYSVR